MFYFNDRILLSVSIREFYLKYSQTMMKHNLHSRDYFPRILQAFQRIRDLSRTRLVIIRAGWWDLLAAGPAIILPKGFEPPTPWFVATCSIPLSYGSRNSWGLRI